MAGMLAKNRADGKPVAYGDGLPANSYPPCLVPTCGVALSGRVVCCIQVVRAQDLT